MVAEWHELGIIAPIEKAPANNELGFLPTKVWKETGRHFSGADPTFAQVLYAEDAYLRLKTDKDMALEIQRPSRERKRRTFRRDER